MFDWTAVDPRVRKHYVTVHSGPWLSAETRAAGMRQYLLAVASRVDGEAFERRVLVESVRVFLGRACATYELARATAEAVDDETTAVGAGNQYGIDSFFRREIARAILAPVSGRAAWWAALRPGSDRDRWLAEGAALGAAAVLLCARESP